MDQTLEDIRTLMLIHRAKSHRRVTSATPAEQIEQIVSHDGETLLFRKWPFAIRSALRELDDVKSMISEYNEEKRKAKDQMTAALSTARTTDQS